jgi:PIN domain nuclease of toxin-antitoxin system
MRLLLDSHIVVWAATANPMLKPRTRELLAANSEKLFFSVAALWECEIKRASGKLVLPSPLRIITSAMNITVLNIESEDAEAATALPRLHSDPFDRLIVAHALRHDCTIVTHDAMIPLYPVPVVRA